ncbi:MAG: hypothetical protein KF709_10590 [Gemmatimonadaceae bacterium]|nr:hypothetical protein [Gemmatimonadaceae bacterium]
MFRSSSVLGSLQDSWARFVELLPDLLLAAALLMAGWLLARIARRLSIRLLRWLKVDVLAERVGFDDFLVQGEVKMTTVTLVANAIYWVILAGVFVALLDALGVNAANDLILAVWDIIPNIVLAIGILLFGSLAARVLGRAVLSYLNNVGSPAARGLAVLTRAGVLIFTVFMAAEQLAIRSEVLVSAFQIAFAAVCLAAAIAFGLGGRAWAEDILNRHFKS